MKNKLDQVLNESNRIDKLNYQSIKELFVKDFLWKPYEKSLLHNNKYSNPLCSQEYEDNLELLKDFEPNYGIGRFVIDNNFNQDLKDTVTDNPKSVVNTLFNKLAKNINKKEQIKIIKNHLKGLLNGSCGMPIHKILRGSIANCLARQELD